MLNTNLIHEVDLLSVKDRVALMEYLARSVQKELDVEPQEEPRLLTNEEKQVLRLGIREELAKYRAQEMETAEERRKRLDAYIPVFETSNQRGAGLELGMLRRMGLPPLTDDEVEEVIAQSLIEKHLK
jgi:hypothetical protein